jgi:hypothetical protein
MSYIQTLRDVKKMEQQSIIFYLARKRLSPLAIHDNFVTTLGTDAVSYSSVIRYLRDPIFSSSNPPTTLPEPEVRLDDCDHSILLTLVERQFTLVEE